MFAQIVPAVRTPHGVDHFDYFIPDGMTVECGQLVTVPFRRRTIPGLVIHCSTQSDFAEKTKSITARYGSLVFPASTIDLLAWTARRTFCSQPTILKAWLRDLPKRIPSHPIAIDLRERNVQGSIHAHWNVFYEKELIETANRFRAQQKRVLILTPWRTRADRYAEALHVPFLDSHQASGGSFQAWQQVLERPNGCLVSTRIGAWLASCVDVVLLDEPENDDHKQDELQPRYDARRLVSWCAMHGGTRIESFGRTPPLHVDAPAPSIDLSLIVLPHHPHGKSLIPCVQADAFLALQAHDGPRVIIHPIRGLMARLHCRDCDWQASCQTCSFPLSVENDRGRCRRCTKTMILPLICPICGGTELNKSIPGIDRLKHAWQTHASDLPVEWRDLTNEQLDAPFKPNALVLITQPQFLGGGSEDLRRKERQCILLRRLAARLSETNGRLIIQSRDEEIEQWPSWLTTQGISTFFEEERATRRLFRYPPSARRIKLILEGNEAAAQTWKEKIRMHLPVHATWEGPFPVAFRRRGQTARTIWHLIVPPETMEQEMIRALEPFANEAIIDLDPIAFFS